MKLEFKTEVKEVETDDNQIPTEFCEWTEDITNECVTATVDWSLKINASEDGIFEAFEFTLNKIVVKQEWDYCEKIADETRDNPAEWSDNETKSHIEYIDRSEILNNYKVNFEVEDIDVLVKGIRLTEIDINTNEKIINLYLNE